ncbi:AmmeMemoRadiSam system protein B [bacterium]|nr:AmmeMemoRadiSam system protein B [bacterium]
MREIIRQSIIAGSWYPGDKDSLTEIIEKYLMAAQIDRIDQPIFGLIVPHAGYVYSGQTAAYAYKLLAGQDISRVIILSPMHHFAAGNFFTPRATHFETPLGKVEIDTEALELLSSHIPLNYLDKDSEHSLEIQLPFLQHVLKDFKVLPLMLGLGNVNGVDSLVSALSVLDKYRQGLCIASSDLHHKSDYYDVVKQDNEVIELIKTGSINSIRDRLSYVDCTVCGRVPIVTMMRLAQLWEHYTVEVLHNENSGDITGEKMPGQYTVGYMSAAIY